MSDGSRLATALSDRYRIERQLGEGGMATVYLAHDLKHDRDVAIKVLKPELAAVLGAERFVQEIATTAQLQHPNILPLFDSGEADGFLYYVMPYVEGESLRDRLDRERQLGVDEAVKLVVEVADALQYAHEQGVVHRDIKPENILLHADRPVVADFGIALAVSAAAGGRMTETGLSLGTPHYMSPEQATAEKEITGRSDIYSLAGVLYEMLAGDPPHTGSSAQQIIVKIIADEPRPVEQVRKSVPPNVAAAVAKALEKLPADRFGSAKAFAEALADPAFRRAGRQAPGVTGGAASGPRGWRGRLRDPFVVAPSLLALGAIAVAGLLAHRPLPATTTVPPIRFLLTTTDSVKPFDAYPWPAAISPDGRTVVYASLGSGAQPILYELRTDELEAHPIPGTAGGTEPYFSPDGEWLAFEQRGEERKVRLDGSRPVTITGGGQTQNGAAWTSNGQIVLGTRGSSGGLSKVSASGGTAVTLTRVDTAGGERAHLWPIVTPDPGTVVFAIWYGALESSTLAAVSVVDGRVTPLGIAGIRPLAVLDRHLVYLQADGAVMAVPIDLHHKRATGPPVPVHDPVRVDPRDNGNSDIFVSRGGALVVGRGMPRGRLAWVSKDGTARIASPDVRTFSSPSLSPDGKHIAVLTSDSHGSDVWIYDRPASTFSRLTTRGTVGSFDWTHDGSDVVFVASDSFAQGTIWSQPAAGGSPPRKLFAEPHVTLAATLAPDGSSLLMNVFRGSFDILRVPLDSVAVARPYIATRFNEFLPEFSPDGKWVAYMSDETGKPEVYVRSFPDPSTKLQISNGTGVVPHWSRDGTRLYYVTDFPHPAILAARVTLSPTFQLLGRDTVASTAAAINLRLGYDVSSDGNRVLGVAPVSGGFQLVVSPNWITELRRRLAAAGGGKRDR